MTRIQRSRLSRPITAISAAPAAAAISIDLTGSGCSAAAAELLGQALEQIEIDLRHCQVEQRSRPYFEPGVESLVDSSDRISHISLGLPHVHLSPDGDLYPQMFRDMSVRTGDSLLKAACGFADLNGQETPAHYRALGRSAFLAAAQSATPPPTSL